MSPIQSATSEAESSLDMEFLELSRSFQLFGIQSLTNLKTVRKRKTLGTKLAPLLLGAFQVYILPFCRFLFY